MKQSHSKTEALGNLIFGGNFGNSGKLFFFNETLILCIDRNFSLFYVCPSAKGYITVEVLRQILHEIDDKITPGDLDLMIEEIDADGSGKSTDSIFKQFFFYVSIILYFRTGTVDFEGELHIIIYFIFDGLYINFV